MGVDCGWYGGAGGWFVEGVVVLEVTIDGDSIIVVVVVMGL